MKTSTELVNHLLSLYGTNAVIPKVDGMIGHFQQRSIKPWDLSQRLWDLKLRCSGVYIEEKLRGLILQGIDLTKHGTLQRWRADNQEATLENLAHQAQSRVDLQSGQ